MGQAEAAALFMLPGNYGFGWNPNDKGANVLLTNNNYSAEFQNTGSANCVRGVVSHTTGKYYLEIVFDTVNTGTNDPMAGIASASWNIPTVNTFNATGAWGIQSSPQFCYGNGSNKASGVSYASGDVAMFAVDIDSPAIWMGKNGTWILSGNPGAGTNPTWTNLPGTGTALYPASRTSNSVSNPAKTTLRVQSTSFSYSIPSGFSEWGLS